MILKKGKRTIAKKMWIVAAAAMLAFLPVGADAASAKVTTPISTLSKKTKVDKYTVEVQKKSGVRTYNVFAQHSKKYKKKSFVAQHGCAVCSLTTVLSGYSKKYKNYTPDKTYKVLEKKVFGTRSWKANYRKSLGAQRPVSLYGISRVLSYCKISNRYVRYFSDKKAVSEIKAHLKTGNAVVIEVNNRRQKNGRIVSGYTNRWSNSKHTMVLLGMTDTGKVIVADSAQRDWSGKKQRIKFAKMEELIKYMIPCTITSNSLYFKSTGGSGGYILVNP